MKQFYPKPLTKGTYVSIRSLIFALLLVSAFHSNGQVTAQIGTGTSFPTNTLYGPIYRFSATSTTSAGRSNMLYTAAEMAAAGIPSGALITQVEFFKGTAGTFTAPSSFSVLMANTSNTALATTLTWSAVQASHTQVYSSTSFNLPATVGWVPWVLSTPFIYTGGALEIATQNTMGSPVTSSDKITWQYSGTSGTSASLIVGAVGTTLPATLNGTVGEYKNRPNIRITYSIAACTNPPTPGTVVASPTTPVCSGSPVALSLTGYSTGTGQSYQWQSASSATGTFTNLGSSSSAPATSVAPTVTTWYRAAVTCGGNTQFSAPIQVVVSQPLAGGTYTIGASGNYASFTDAANAISCGILGPVTFNVAPGTYNEQVTIPQVPGASAVNTITFNGNGATLAFASTNTAARAGITLNGADHVRINNLVIDGTAGTFGWGVLLTNRADSNVISNSTINVSTTSTVSADHVPIVISGSTTSATSSGNNGNGNLFTGNTLSGGYYGIVLYGSSTAGARNLNNRVVGNTIKDFYVNGVHMVYQSGALVSGNDISRPTRTNATTTGGIYVSTGNVEILVEKNRIHNLFDAMTTSTSTAYGIYVSSDALAGQEVRLINNAIYNMNSNGTVYGIYNTAGPYMQAYHNSISLDFAGTTTGNTYGLYQTGTAVGIEFKNNTVAVSRAGTGTKRAIHFNTIASTIASDYNVLYINDTLAAENKLGQFGTTTFASLASWQTANGGAYDQHSIAADPGYTSVATGNLFPTNPQLDGAGTALGVTTDIMATNRDLVAPTPGAWELPPSVGTDMGVKGLLLPLQKDCFSSTETVTVTIRNNSAGAHNFASKPVTVNATVTGANPQVFTPVVVNTGVLAAGDTLNVVITASYNMSALGNYVFNASTSVSGDANTSNDDMLPATRTAVAVDAGTISTNVPAYCVTPGTPMLTLSGNEGGNIQWQQSTAAAGPWVNVGTNTVTYSPATPITTTMYYRAVLSCNAVSDTTNVVTVTYSNPLVLTTTPAARCGTGEVTLGATASTGAVLNWYTTATGGTPVGTGTSFITPVISATTNFYVGASGGVTLESTGKATYTGTANTNGNNWGLVFDVVSTPINLVSVDVYSVSTAGSLSVNLTDNNGTVLASAGPFSYPGGTTASPVKVTLPLNFTVPVGTGYRIVSAGMTGGNLIRETTGNSFPYSSPSGNVVVSSGFITNPGSGSYYWFYNWKVTTSCESPRQAVAATVSSAAAFDLTTNTTICNNAITPLMVVTDTSQYTTYTWSPVTNLYTNAAATVPYTGGSATKVYLKSATPGLVTYYAEANNTTTSCANLDSVKVNILPAVITINSTKPDICVSGSSDLSLNPATGYGAATFQWYASTDGITYNAISGVTGTSYTTPVLTNTTYYKVEVKDAEGNTCQQPQFTLTVNQPQLTSTTPGTRCGPGPVVLSAAGTGNNNFFWYTSATGGAPVGSGANFTTPILNNTTTYYVSAATGNTPQLLGAASPAAFPTASTLSSFTAGMLFTVATGGTTIQSVDIFPTAAVGTNFQVVVRQTNGTGAVLYTYQGTTTVTGTATAPVAQTVPVNFTLPAGTYAMTFFNGALTAPLTGTAVYPGALRNSPATGSSFPYSIPGTISITNGTGNNIWYYFYNWKIGNSCESPRQAVTATVSAGPAFDVTDNTTICNGAIQALSVNSPVSNFNTYSWSPATNLFTDAAATVPYTGGSATTVYIRTTAANTYTYVVNALNTTSNCSGIDSVKVTVLPSGVVVNATPSQICVSGQSALSIAPATGYTGATFQWQSSTDNVNWTNISGATAATYTTAVITSTTHYRVQIRDAAGNVCQQPSRTIQVNSPSVVSSQGAVNCGSGSVNLTATGSAGTVLNWYTNATGGAPVATGTSFTTPVLTGSTTYYVSATSGGSIQGVGPVGPASTGLSGIATGATTTQGLLFDVDNAAGVNIQSVDIFPTAPVGTAFTIAIRQGSATGALVPGASYSGVTTVSGTTGAPVAQTVPVNFTLPVGFDYVMVYTTAVTSVRNGTATVFPQSIPGQITIQNGVATGTWNYFYNWRVGNGCESPRVAVTATISPNTAINTQPVGQTICSGATLNLSVNAVGAGLAYQWFKGTTAIPGATSATYTITNAQTTDAGTYSVRVTGTCGTVTSTVVTVNVNGTNSWLGTTSNDWHNPANWCGSVPTATSDIVIPAGTPHQPVVTALAEARNITIQSGASVGVQPNGFLSIYGNLQNSGSFNAATGFVGFKGAAAQTTTAITVGTLVMNGTGGLTLLGNVVTNTLILERGNITLDAHNLTVSGSANGSVDAHVITNATGSVISRNVSSGVIVPVGPNATSYNPAIITNGQGRDYTVRVAVGLNPGVSTQGRAINRTWTILPSATVTTPVELTLQWDDQHGNASVTPGSDMEVAVHTGAGAQWNILTPPGGLTPVGVPAQRKVTVLAQSFGSFIVASPGGFSYPLSAPSVDPDVQSVQLLPNVVHSTTTLRVRVQRATQINWVLVDASGKAIQRFQNSYTTGQHDQTLQLSTLAKGNYYLSGYTKRGKTTVIKLIKL